MVLTQRHSNTIAIILFLMAVIRIPAELGHGRDMLLGTTQLGVLILFAMVLIKENIWFGLFLVLALHSSTFPFASVESRSAFRCVFVGLAWFYFVSKYGDTNILLNTICLIALAHFAVTTIMFFGLPWIMTGGVVGLTYNPNEGSTMFALCIPAFLKFFNDRELNLGKLSILFVVAGLAMIKSFGGVVASAVGLIFWGYFVGYGRYVMLAAVLGPLVYLLIDAPDISHRANAWKQALIIYKQNWLFGCGIGHWKIVVTDMAKYRRFLVPGEPIVWTRLHNSYINGLIEMGIGFIPVVAGYFIHTVMRFKKENLIPYTALVIAAVCCCFNSVFRMNAVNGMLIITWLAILNKENKNVR